jgi:pilus assembly protein CpaB
MSPGRRAAVLGGLAVVLGSLAASDVSGREAALRRGLGPIVPVVVARGRIPAGAPIRAMALAVRRTPSRYAPAQTFRDPAEVVGGRAGVPIPAGTDLQPALLAGAGAGSPATARPGERIARIVAVGAAGELSPGTLTDVLITRDGPGGAARTRLALRAAQVVASAPAPRAPEGDQAGLPRVALALRVTLRQAIALVEAQNGARELRALPRPGASTLR